jgi:hypothetical protein
MFGAASSAFAQAAPVSSGFGYKIAGIVVSKTDGHPLARTRVVLANVKEQKTPLSLVTGEDGRFAFSDLPAGKFSLLGAKRGFNTAHYEEHIPFLTAIVTGANIDTEHLILRLTPGAYVVGKVLDENSEPLRRANVKLYVVNHDEGASRVVGNRDGMTDDRGAYELGPLIPGTYYVSARAEPWYAVHPPEHTELGTRSLPTHVDPGLDVAYPVTYYGDTSDADSAAPIQVRGGERVEADVHLAPVLSLHLLVHVPDGGANGTPVPQLWESGFGEDIGVPGVQPRLVSPGVWELSGVPQGNYKVGIFGGPNQGVRTTELSATADGEEIDTSDVQPLSTVKVSVQLPGEKAVPSTLALALRIPHGNVKSWSKLDAKGEAQLHQVAPGRYEVTSWNMGRPYGIVHVGAEGCDLSGRLVTINAGSSASISVTLVAGVGTVEGVVKRKEKPLAGAMVVLVPNDPAEHLDLFRRDQSDLDGTFAINNVVAGTYTILAIDDGWDMDWSRPEVIAPYLQHGQTILVGGQPNGNVRVADVVEAQPKM